MCPVCVGPASTAGRRAGGPPAGSAARGAGRRRRPATLTHDLDVAVAHLRGLPDVDPARIVLVGHSMGAGAVTRYAADHPEILDTVAISLPDAGEPDLRAGYHRVRATRSAHQTSGACNGSRP